MSVEQWSRDEVAAMIEAALLGNEPKRAIWTDRDYLVAALAMLTEDGDRARRAAIADDVDAIDEPPSLDTVEGKRFLLAARCAQARLLVEMLRPETVEPDELEVLDAVAGACSLLAIVADRHDWSNAEGE